MNCPICTKHPGHKAKCFTCDKGAREVKEGVGWFACECEGDNMCEHYIPHCCMPNWLCAECGALPGYISTPEGFGSGPPMEQRACERCTVYLF